MEATRAGLKLLVLITIMASFAPFKIGLRRKDIFKQVLIWLSRGQGVFSYDDKAALNMRLQRLLKRMVGEGLLKRDDKGHKKVFYKLHEDAYIQYMKHEGFLKDENDLDEYKKSIRNTIINQAGFLILPPYIKLIGNYDPYEELDYESFKAKMIENIVEILEPQIQKQWDVLDKEKTSSSFMYQRSLL